MIPLVLRASRPGGAPISVFGTDYPTPDGTAIRDYIHVSDLANAHVQALEALHDRTGFEAYNLGTGSGHSVNEIIGAARRLTKCSVNVVTGQRRAGDPPELVADAAKAERELGWTSPHSSLDEILASAWRWECSHRAAAGQDHK